MRIDKGWIDKYVDKVNVREIFVTSELDCEDKLWLILKKGHLPPRVLRAFTLDCAKRSWVHFMNFYLENKGVPDYNTGSVTDPDVALEMAEYACFAAAEKAMRENRSRWKWDCECRRHVEYLIGLLKVERPDCQAIEPSCNTILKGI